MKNLTKEQEVWIHGQVKLGNDYVPVNSRGGIVDPCPHKNHALCYIEDIAGRDEILEVNKRFIG